MNRIFLSAAACVLAAALSLAGALPAHAATLAEQAREAGLLGKWQSGGCDEPPSLSDPYNTYATKGSGVALIMDYGSGTAELKVTKISRTNDLLVVEVFYPNMPAIDPISHKQESKTMVLSYFVQDGKMRVKFNRHKGGSFTVKEFVQQLSMKETPWRYRCGE